VWNRDFEIIWLSDLAARHSRNIRKYAVWMCAVVRGATVEMAHRGDTSSTPPQPARFEVEQPVASIDG
jgi:hypothetical protein